MIDLGPHGIYIWLSYAAAALCVGGLVAWVQLSERAQHRRLAELERQGITRRSAAR